MKISYIVSLVILAICSAVLQSADLGLNNWQFWVVFLCLIGYGICNQKHKGEVFKKKEKPNKYTIEDAIKDRQNKNYIKEVNEITKNFNKWLDEEIKRSLRDTNNQVIATFEISSVSSRLKYGYNNIETSSLTFEIYETIKLYVKEVCEKYNFLSIENGQLNCANEGQNGVKFLIQYEAVEAKN